MNLKVICLLFRQVPHHLVAQALPPAPALSDRQVNHIVILLLEILVDPLARTQVPIRALLLVKAPVQALVVFPVDLPAMLHLAVSTPAVLLVIAQV